MEPRRRKRGGLGTSSSPNPAEAHHPPGTPPHGPGSQDGLAKYCPATVSPLSRSRAAPSGDGPTPWKKPGSCPATLHGTGRSRMTYLGPHLTGPGVRTGSPPPPGSRLAVTTLACGPVRRRAHPVEGTPDPAPPPSSGRADLGWHTQSHLACCSPVNWDPPGGRNGHHVLLPPGPDPPHLTERAPRPESFKPVLRRGCAPVRLRSPLPEQL